jgi:hypothetical protein
MDHFICAVPKLMQKAVVVLIKNVRGELIVLPPGWPLPGLTGYAPNGPVRMTVVAHIRQDTILNEKIPGVIFPGFFNG